MTFKVEVGPPQIAIHHAQTVLITETNGEVGWPSDKGLYFLDTRLVSRLGNLCQWRGMGPAEWRRGHLA